MNVFVLSPGRAGSTTFAHACAHLSNFSSGHESRATLAGPGRFAYPERHIEADNRLCWMLGLLGRAFDGKEVLYVDLRRDKSLIVESFLDRWETSTFPAQIMPAFAHGIIMNPWPWQPEKREDVARFYVETVYANIEEFLKNRNSLTVTLGDSFSFDSFLETIGAEGNLKGARAEWEKIHNPR